MTENYICNVIEAALLAAGRPLQVADLAQLFDDLARPSTDELQAAVAALAAQYEGRGIELRETASGWRIQVRAQLANEVSRLWPERPPRYSRALLETLALIAYRQPITRGEIEAVRGVAVNPNILKTLLERNWIRVVGHRDVPGRPELLGTTREFLDYFGLKSLDQLPPLAELKAMTDPNLPLDLPAAPVTGEGEAGTPAAESGALTAVPAGEAAEAGGEAVGDAAAGDADAAPADAEGATDAERAAHAEDAPQARAAPGEEIEPASAAEDAAATAEDDGTDDDELSASADEAPPGLVAAPPDDDR